MTLHVCLYMWKPVHDGASSVWVENHLIKVSCFWQLPCNPPGLWVGVRRVGKGLMGLGVDDLVPKRGGQGCCHLALVETGLGWEKGWGW